MKLSLLCRQHWMAKTLASSPMVKLAQERHLPWKGPIQTCYMIIIKTWLSNNPVFYQEWPSSSKKKLTGTRNNSTRKFTQKYRPQKSTVSISEIYCMLHHDSSKNKISKDTSKSRHTDKRFNVLAKRGSELIVLLNFCNRFSCHPREGYSRTMVSILILPEVTTFSKFA